VQQVARAIPAVEAGLEERVGRLGFELVEVEWAGSDRRPILRVRVDVAEERACEGRGVTVDDCAWVSRELEPWLDQLEVVPEHYVLEVSSPGLDRPLTRVRDWVRFTGQQVAIRGPRVLAGRATRLEGELVGLRRDERERERVVLRLASGEEVEVPKDEISRAHLVYRWK
jgi:ribosome maturation factor RimP